MWFNNICFEYNSNTTHANLMNFTNTTSQLFSQLTGYHKSVGLSFCEMPILHIKV